MNMDVATIGFLKADRRRQRILEMIGKRSTATAQQVSHRLRIHPRQANAALKELLEKGLLKDDKGKYLLTDEGIKVLTQVSRAGM